MRSVKGQQKVVEKYESMRKWTGSKDSADVKEREKGTESKM